MTYGGDLGFICLGAFITGAFGRLMAGDRIKNRGEKELLLVRDPYLPCYSTGLCEMAQIIDQ